MQILILTIVLWKYDKIMEKKYFVSLKFNFHNDKQFEDNNNIYKSFNIVQTCLMFPLTSIILLWNIRLLRQCQVAYTLGSITILTHKYKSTLQSI